MYLIDKEGIFTQESLKACRSLDACNYFYNAYMQTVYYYRVMCVLKAKVSPSQKSARHSPWVVIKAYDDLQCSVKVTLQCPVKVTLQTPAGATIHIRFQFQL